jgi:hypothetical protein
MKPDRSRASSSDPPTKGSIGGQGGYRNRSWADQGAMPAYWRGGTAISANPHIQLALSCIRRARVIRTQTTRARIRCALTGVIRPQRIHRHRSGHPAATPLLATQICHWTGAATPVQRNTTHAQDRARRASDVFNISNRPSGDNPHSWTVQPSGPPCNWVEQPGGRAIDTWTRATEDVQFSSSGAQVWAFLRIACEVVAGCLVGLPRRSCDRLFTMNDTEAYWRGWQIIRVHGGLGRAYRDPRFDTGADR